MINLPPPLLQELRTILVDLLEHGPRDEYEARFGICDIVFSRSENLIDHCFFTHQDVCKGYWIFKSVFQSWTHPLHKKTPKTT